MELNKNNLKDGSENNVGNPMSKSLLLKYTEGVMDSHHSDYGKLLVTFDANMNYWEKNEKRIR